MWFSLCIILNWFQSKNIVLFTQVDVAIDIHQTPLFVPDSIFLSF